MERHGIAVVVDDGVQQQSRGIEHGALLMARKTGRSHGEQGMEASVVSSTSALDFFWRIFARVAVYVTRVRRFFFFKLAKDGSLEVKEERHTSEISENKVEGGFVEASRAQCEPELAEVIVTAQKETTDHADVDTKVVEVSPENCASKCTRESKGMDEESETLARIVEHISATEKSSSDACQQEPISVACEHVILVEAHDKDCTANEEQKCRSLEQTASQERDDGLSTADGEAAKCHCPEQNDSQDEELATNNKSDVLQSLSQLSSDNTENPMKGGSDAEFQGLTSSRALKRRVSIKELNAVVAEQLTKCLQALERNVVPGKAEHWRAIILATLVAVAVWARNAKHLHESMPRIRGSAINVHIRSRL